MSGIIPCMHCPLWFTHWGFKSTSGFLLIYIVLSIVIVHWSWSRYFITVYLLHVPVVQRFRFPSVPFPSDSVLPVQPLAGPPESGFWIAAIGQHTLCSGSEPGQRHSDTGSWGGFLHATSISVPASWGRPGTGIWEYVCIRYVCVCVFVCWCECILYTVRCRCVRWMLILRWRVSLILDSTSYRPDSTRLLQKMKR